MSRYFPSSWLVPLLLLITMGLFSLSALASDRLVWEGNGHSYQRFENTVSWTEAQTYCESQSGYLATITSKEEKIFIFLQLGTIGLVWLGGTDAGHEGTWSWVTNEPWNYSNWDEGEPNNGYGNENYLLMNYYGTWNDMSLDNRLWFVCEWNNNQSNDTIILTLEEPANGSTYSGISNVRGWAVAPQGVKKVELYMDGVLIGNIPLGGKRSDVGATYPSYPGSTDSGFAMAFNYSEHSTLTAGSHTFTVRAYDNAGGSRDASAIVNVVQFASSYISDPMAINVDSATITRGGNAITVQNLLAEGQSYTIQLNWRPAVQGFAITQINRTNTTAAGTPPDWIYQNSSQATEGTQASSSLLTTPMVAGDSIVMNLEEPAPSSIYSGISNVRGWAVAPQGLQKVELYVDGVLKGNLPLGGLRTDVSHTYPDYPGAAQSGFAMAFNYSGLAAGSHTFTVRAYDNAGGARDVNATISVVRFMNPYMADPAAVNMDSATINRGGNAITVQNLLAEGQPYTVQLNWRPATQGFAITQINSASGGGDGCNYTINPKSQQFSDQNGSGDVTVSTQPGCSWTAKNNVDWIAIASGTNETGPGIVKYLVSRNMGVELRTGTLTIAGKEFTVYQDYYKGDSGGAQ